MDTYTQKNKLYEGARVKRAIALDLYDGADRVEKKEEYLVKHPFETDKQYDIRLARATYRNFAAPIVDVFSSFICEKRPERTLPSYLDGMLKDVDRLGKNADTFFNDIVRLAAAGGVRFVLVDSEAQRGVTIEEDRSAGRRLMPYFVSVNPDDVYDWRIDEKGLAWAVIHSSEELDRQPFGDPVTVDALTVWTRYDWKKYRGAESAERTESAQSYAGVYTQDSSGKHSLGEVPLVMFAFEPVTPMTGLPVTDDVLSLLLRVYRRDSELDKMLFDCAVPLGIINGLDKETQDNFVRASSNVLFSSEPSGINGTYVEPSGNSFRAQREAIDADIASIREIALRMVRPESAVAESAESKSIDKQQLDTQLANFARRCANAEYQCWSLAARWMGQKPGEKEIATPYNEDYDVEVVKEESIEAD
jgi:hypothetical protein